MRSSRSAPRRSGDANMRSRSTRRTIRRSSRATSIAAAHRFHTLNQAESALLSARNGLAQAQADQATALIQLYSALGGGWDSASIPEAPASPTGSTADGH